ncbi:MAG: LacI family DNA-binding transcriptional regulator [Ignavibacteria bacterium]|jgi:LacI family transcriptional regulator
MKSTIKDVARKAGVSIATVSLVIHNNDRISSDTRKKVNKAIKELEYYPSRSARDLVSKKTGNIGFVLTGDHFLRTEPFYTRIFLGTEFEARDGEYYILLTTVKSDFNEDDLLPRFVLDRSVDGIIIAGKVPEKLIKQLSQNRIPLVFVDYISGKKNYPAVLIDNIQGGTAATEHLLDLGHRNVAFIGGDIEHPSINERLTGYKKALENKGISPSKKFISVSSPYPDRHNGYKSAKKIFDNNKDVTAVFACNDAMAIGAMHYLKENGYEIPGDVSIIGFDDVEANLLLDPPLTTMRVPKIELGIEAMRLMIEILHSKKIDFKKIIVPVELIIRKSTAELR